VDAIAEHLEETEKQEGIRRAAEWVLDWHKGDRKAAVAVLRRWVEEGADGRYGEVADFIEREAPALS
jgi:hypothetical protein